MVIFCILGADDFRHDQGVACPYSKPDACLATLVCCPEYLFLSLKDMNSVLKNKSPPGCSPDFYDFWQSPVHIFLIPF